jgi:ABC-type phosphate transport system substrate-binding protein
MRLFLLTLLLFTQAAFADLYVIAHNSFSEDSVNASMLRNIYSGDTQYINDLRIIALDQDTNSENYANFYSNVIDKPMAQIISHWSKLIFTGKGQAPMSLAGDMSVTNFVQNNPNAIGYVDAKSKPENVKIIHTLKISNYKALGIDSLKSR